ncbi:MAG: hypothetical protein C5B52_18850 [Bacteroidetes bacterium]|nr:MAG: hypothetical protein C5B52_18850 [Bacteroidota bacterium]
MKSNSVSNILAFTLFASVPVFLAGNKIPTGSVADLTPVIYKIPVKSDLNSKAAYVSQIYDSIQLNKFGLEKRVLELAMKGFDKLMKRGLLSADSILSIADFSKSSREKRFYVIDLKNYTLLFNTRVAHGRNSGMDYAKWFSNNPSSNKSSLGFYVTQNTYNGDNGFSLRLQGIERGINDKALRRNIVVHGADYAEEDFINARGHLGRSFGCPALPMNEHKEIIDAIKDGTCLFIYSPDKRYLKYSKLLNG